MSEVLLHGPGGEAVGPRGEEASYEPGTPVGAVAGEKNAGEEEHHDRPRLPPLLVCFICAIFARHVI
jgi:hypothetical protein